MPYQFLVQYCHFIHLENTRAPKDFWCFQKVLNGNIGYKWVKQLRFIAAAVLCGGLDENLGLKPSQLEKI